MSEHAFVNYNDLSEIGYIVKLLDMGLFLPRQP